MYWGSGGLGFRPSCRVRREMSRKKFVTHITGAGRFCTMYVAMFVNPHVGLAYGLAGEILGGLRVTELPDVPSPTTTFHRKVFVV